MIFYLKEELKFHNDRGDVIVALKKGMELQSISPRYIAKGTDIYLVHSGPWGWNPTREKIEKEALIVYYRGKYIAVPKSICEIPLTVGWRYNL